MTTARPSSRARAEVARRAAETAPPRELTPTEELLAKVASFQTEFASVLPGRAALTPERFVRVVQTAIRTTKNLADCTPQSVMGAVMTAAQLGLELNTPLGHAYLIPFRNKRGYFECQLIIGYKGYIDLARRSGNIESITARVVHENDEFEVAYGIDDKLIHVPEMHGERGAAWAYYGVAKYQGGGYNFIVLTRDDVEKIRARSKAKDNGPWVTDFDAMACKSCIRQLVKFLPLSVELAQAAAADGAIRTDLDPTALDRDVIILDDDGEIVDQATGEMPQPQAPLGEELADVEDPPDAFADALNEALS